MNRKKKWLAALAAAVTAVGIGVQVGIASAESNGGVRIMPLGDSITEGTQVPGGYRIGLWNRLAAGGYRNDFVGSQFNGPGQLGDHDHQGHPGWRIDQIDANIVNWLRNTTPRSVLLHIGTNDVLQNYNVSGAPTRLSNLVDKITNTVPTADVFVASIIPISNSGQNTAARNYNSTIPGMVQNKRNAGKKVHFVDMYSALTTGDLIDGVHPTANGYDKMAARWFSALQAVPGSIGNGSTPTTPATTAPGGSSSALANAASGRCLDVPGSNTANGTQPIIWDCSGAANQRWTYNGQTLQALGKCLDSPTGATAGTKAQLYDCHSGTNQRWTLNADGTIRNAQSGFCLDVNRAATANGSTVILWTCTGAANQRWTRR